MNEAFWTERWENNQIGFHQAQINPFLQQYFHLLNTTKGQTVFVPLCGKTLDMVWLVEQGVDVLGVEFSEKAIKEFYQENHLDYQVAQSEAFIEYSNEHIKLLSGDFFAMGEQQLSGIMAVFERASLIALPQPMRVDYVNHLAKHLAQGCRILMITMEYPEGMISGPPFAVLADEVEQLFKKDFTVELLESKQNQAMGKRLAKASGGSITEKVWLIEKK